MKRNLSLLLALVIIGAPGMAHWMPFLAQSAQAAERKVLYYQDSMHPSVKSDRPGKCTICSMDLTPIYEGDQGFAMPPGTVVLSSNNITVLNVQTEQVKRQPLSRTFRIAGTLEANETRKSIVSAPARGRIDALNVDYVGVEVERGQKLMTMFSPELVQLRKTLLAVRQNTPLDGTNVAPKPNLDPGLYTGDILAPQSGMVLERNVYLGQYVTEGDRLLVLADASALWFRFDVYERQLSWIEVGQKLEVTVQAVPGKVFPAVISFIEPAVNDTTRAARVRADISNLPVTTNGRSHRALRFGMYAEGIARTTVNNVLTVPRSAVLLPGTIAYAYVDKGGGAYERRRLKLGRQGDDFWEVLKGVEEGENVVTSGNVLMDAQAQINMPSQPETDGNEPAMEEPVMVMPAAAVMSHPMVTQAPVVPQSPAVKVQSITEEAMSHSMLAGYDTNADASQMSLSTNKAPSYGKLASASRTERMAAIMSPGSELQWVRRNAILAELAQNGTNGAQTNMDQSLQPMPMAAADNQSAPQEMAMPTADMPGSETNASNTTSAMPSEPVEQKADASALTVNERSALVALVMTSDGISQALAADDLAKFNQLLSSEPNALLALPQTFGANHRWSQLIQRLATLGNAQPATDLAGARKQFLPFSTAMAELTKQLRISDAGFADLKIYHCPMAPKPGLWMQAKGPLRNPFYGSKMLTCGEEVAK